jgi:hypothetical protein
MMRQLVVTLPRLPAWEVRASMRKGPDPRRTERLWVVRGVLFGLPTGPLPSIAVKGIRISARCSPRFR